MLATAMCAYVNPLASSNSIEAKAGAQRQSRAAKAQQHQQNNISKAAAAKAAIAASPPKQQQSGKWASLVWTVAVVQYVVLNKAFFQYRVPNLTLGKAKYELSISRKPKSNCMQVCTTAGDDVDTQRRSCPDY